MKTLVAILIAIFSLAALLWAVTSIAGWKFKRHYVADVLEGLHWTTNMQPSVITEADVAHLPELVRN